LDPNLTYLTSTNNFKSNLIKHFHVTCCEASMRIWLQHFGGP